MRLTWLGNAPWTNYGYGQQAALFAPRLTEAGHPIGIIANYGHQGTPINYKNVQVFGPSFDLWGMDVIHGHSKTFQADALISMMDIQMFATENLLGTKWLPWFPVDHVTIPPAIFEKLQHAFHPIAMSKHVSAEMDKAGMEYSYIPCGVDTEIFKPLDRALARETQKLPMDKFIVGMVAANKGMRKAFHQNIMAFAALKAKYGDCVLYLHALDGLRNAGETVDLVAYCKAIGLKVGYAFEESADNADVIFAHQYGLALGYDAPMMAQLYASMDVHMGVTMGEGFGIPIIEAQACGTPVIVGDWTSMPELVFSGWKVAKSDAEMIYTPLNSFQYLPHPGAIAEKLELAYQMRGNMDYRKRAADGAKAYDADRIIEKYWLPTLAKVAEKLQEKVPYNLDTNLGVLRNTKKHVHEWSALGLHNDDGTISMPCLNCNDEIQIDYQSNWKTLIPNGYAPLDGLDFLPDTDGVTKIVTREIKRDYKLDNLDIKDGDTIVDIGAHKGIVSSYLAKQYPHAQIIAFEPMPENYAALLENLERNNITNVIPVNRAVTKDGRQVSISTEANHSGGANIYKADGATVESVTLDDIFAAYNINRLSLLKIDCEGAEFEILGSANGLLKRIDALRGEFHKPNGDVEGLLAKVKAEIPDVVVTVQG